MDKTTEFKVIIKYDDPVGIWYNCIECKNQSFVPDFDTDDKETNGFKFCPYCGKKILIITYL